MIFYFTGTGNSYAVAKAIADGLGENLVAINLDAFDSKAYSIPDGETLGVVFPIYAWGPPEMVLSFIEKVHFEWASKPYVFSIATCGENCGNAFKMLEKSLEKKSLHLNSAFSVTMPNNYVLMGDVDSLERKEDLLSSANQKTEAILRKLINRESHVFDVTKGPVPFVLTGVLHPLFLAHGMDVSKFKASEACTGCGICEKVCPSNNIIIEGKNIIWGKSCTGCLGCLHHCPVRAIDYGQKTSKKGRYTHPESIKRLF